MDKMKQKIWCIASDKLFAKGKWNGINTNEPKYYFKLLNEEGEFRERGPLEEDPSYKQIIGQIVLQVGNKFLIHQIKPAGSEARLHDLWPIVVGGHIEEIDRNEDGDLVTNGVEREFEEEVHYGGKILQKDFLGLIYIENENPVNAVHVGLAYRFLGDSEDVSPTEEEIGEMHFTDIDYLKENINNLTYWSRELVPVLEKFVR